MLVHRSMHGLGHGAIPVIADNQHLLALRSVHRIGHRGNPRGQLEDAIPVRTGIGIGIGIGRTHRPELAQDRIDPAAPSTSNELIGYSPHASAAGLASSPRRRAWSGARTGDIDVRAESISLTWTVPRPRHHHHVRGVRDPHPAAGPDV